MTFVIIVTGKIPIFQVPYYCVLQPLPEWHLCLEPEFLLCPAYVKRSFWLAVRFSCVPPDFSFVICKITNKINQITYGNLHTRSKIYRVRLVITLCGENQPRCCVIDIQEFT